MTSSHPDSRLANGTSSEEDAGELEYHVVERSL